MQDGQLVFEEVEALPDSGEGEAVSVVFGLVPARSEPYLNPTLAHVVDLRHCDCERPDRPERGWAHERAEPDRAVSRARPASVVHASVYAGKSGGSPIFR